jgi:hypothetical protein
MGGTIPKIRKTCGSDQVWKLLPCLARGAGRVEAYDVRAEKNAERVLRRRSGAKDMDTN